MRQAKETTKVVKGAGGEQGSKMRCSVEQGKEGSAERKAGARGAQQTSMAHLSPSVPASSCKGSAGLPHARSRRTRRRAGEQPAANSHPPSGAQGSGGEQQSAGSAARTMPAPSSHPGQRGDTQAAGEQARSSVSSKRGAESPPRSTFPRTAGSGGTATPAPPALSAPPPLTCLEERHEGSGAQHSIFPSPAVGVARRLEEASQAGAGGTTEASHATGTRREGAGGMRSTSSAALGTAGDLRHGQQQPEQRRTSGGEQRARQARRKGRRSRALAAGAGGD